MTTVRHADPAVTATPAGLVVRIAGVDDLEVVVALRLQLLAEEARAPLVSPPRPELLARARELSRRQLASPTDVIFLATRHGEDAGMLRVAVSNPLRLLGPSRYGFITSAYVAPAHRRQGVLRALVAAGEAWCREHELCEVRLHCGVQNGAGNAAWEALGFGVSEFVRRRTFTQEETPCRS